MKNNKKIMFIILCIVITLIILGEILVQVFAKDSVIKQAKEAENAYIELNKQF